MSPRQSLARPAQVTQVSAGFTLIESVLVILILGVISAYVVPQTFNISHMTLDVQAKTLASDLQGAQLLATTSGSRVYFCTASTGKGYWIQLSKPCATVATPIVSVSFDNQATLPATALSVSFDSLGVPSSSANFVLSSFPANSGSITVTTAAVTGLVSLSP